MKQNFSVKIQIVIFLLIAGGVLLWKGIKPHYNWDLLGYTAVIYEWEADSPEEIHRKVYALIKEKVPPARYDELAVLTPYEKANADDYEVFNSQLPFYRVRPLYNGLNYLAFKLGVPLIEFTYLSTIAAYMLIMVLFLFWLNKILKPRPSLGVTIGMFGVMYYTKVMFFSTPDALAALAVFIALYYMIEKEKFTVGFILLFIAQLLRNDIILYSAITFISVIIFKRDKAVLRPGIVFIIVSIIAYFAVGKIFGAYSFSTTFYHTFIKIQTRPDLLDYSLTASDYFHVFSVNFNTLFERFFLLCWIVPILLSVTAFMKISHGKNLVFWSIVVTVLVFGRFLVFPVVWHRFFTQFYFIDLVLISMLIRNVSRKYTKIGGIFRKNLPVG